MMKRIVKIGFLIAILIAPTFASAITENEYKELRTWTLGSSGTPSARWGDKDCKVWGAIYKDCKHPGVDYGTGGKYDLIYSAGSGVVTGTGGSTGKVCVYNKSRDTTLCYLHLSSIKVNTGWSVDKGTVIGNVGKTGAAAIHLHFEARKGNRSSAASSYSDSINPYNAAKSTR
jgi:murein DD-endopeptidase MepM/ murein hydrolase activator NlpD